MKKILIVDDSIIYRHALNSVFCEQKDYVILTAKNGEDAINILKTEKIDLMTLDVVMPVMDGFEVLENLIRHGIKTKIIVFTSADVRGANNAFRALSLGADDFITKIEGTTNIENNIDEIKKILLPRAHALLNEVHLIKKEASTLRQSSRSTDLKLDYKYISISASTGGPEALKLLFNNLNGGNKLPIFIVQHMPPIYTALLAENLQKISGYIVEEAKNGMKVEFGHCYVAPGDFHMELNTTSSGLEIVLNKNEKECFVRPCANYLIRSSKNIAKNTLYIVLTGMGNDGLSGLESILGENPDIVVQDQATSVVWGMPGEIAIRNYENAIMKIDEIKSLLLSVVGGRI